MSAFDEEISDAVEAFLEDDWEEEEGQEEELEDSLQDEPDENFQDEREKPNDDEDFFGDGADDDIFGDIPEDDLRDSSPSAGPSSNALEAEEDVLPAGVPPPTKDHERVLHEFFGHSSFRPMQWKIIHAVMQKQDNCVVMATGYGKSLCYQFPAVYQQGVTVVVSPLISLMRDQVLGLEALGIPACFLGSAQTKKREVFAEMFQGSYRLVYVTPEFVVACIDLLKDLMNKVGIMLFAIDEAHCLSQWGHDFRSSYRKLDSIRKNFPGTPILALTATATQRVQRDICSVLRLRSPVVTVTSFDRPNLYLEVRPKTKRILEDILSLLVKDGKGKYTVDGSTIIYCPTKKTTETVASELKRGRLECRVYHAGMSQTERDISHQSFVCDKVKIIVATVAFGMGIDKPDVRRVIHYGAPGNPESYYQEIGRAGRDGLPSTCTVFYAPGDTSSYKFLISLIKKEEFMKHQMEMLNKIIDLLTDNETCRRASIISHFTSKLDKTPPRKDCCDNCTNKLQGNRPNKGSARVNAALDEEGKYDFTEDAKKLLETSERCPNCAVSAHVSILKGLKSQRVKPHWKKFPTYGAGKNRNENYWKELVQMLVRAGLLSEELIHVGGGGGGRGRGRGWGRGGGGSMTFSYNAIKLNEKGYQVLRDPSAKICLKPSTVMLEQLRYVIKRVEPESGPDIFTSTGPGHRTFNPRDFLFQPSAVSPIKEQRVRPSAPSIVGPSRPARRDATKDHQGRQAEDASTSVNEVDDVEQLKIWNLYQSLVVLRNCVADEKSFMPYLLANDHSLMIMAKERPTTPSALHSIEGMSEARVKQFGPYFITHIRSFCKAKDLACPEYPEGDAFSPDKQSWTFKETSFGWEFRVHHSTTSLPESSSSGWLSKPRRPVDSSSEHQPGSSSEDKAAATSNRSDEGKGKSSSVSGTGVSLSNDDDDFLDSLLESEAVDFSKDHRDETQNRSQKTSECRVKKEEVAIPKSSSNSDVGLKEISSQGNRSASYPSSSQDRILKNKPSLSQFSYKPKEEGVKEDIPLKFEDSSQVNDSTLQDLYRYKPRAKRGIQLVESGSEEKTESTSSSSHYEEILKEKGKSASQWISARKKNRKFKF
ncbi:bifunctional 3'-5' exonuclease/ATP-dependent helicase WRN-like isoform X2 [Eriocheir sinensis]|nr:bifunctional 3'-5' exonuclease/ATP-dependent helicase WRN-like isoform X2 [Eriocheir sinensis]XP_050725164.1 bifunctional 3'-5' exonuclease/ATP-dependent helicase WRN-like isoform X2 [Eriocheir sinensis]XP_050725165.1 bifunctional 3'-5' exonuclease/ATP-dependent helicase WRN-like isoform X2 [Eriocheir sinensis]